MMGKPGFPDHSRRSLLPHLPLTLRVPVVVAGLMILVSVIVSERALSRFDATQARHFVELGNAYLDGLTPALVPAVVREDAWEVFDVLDRSRGLYRGLELIETVVVSSDGRVIAASDPRQTPVGSFFYIKPNVADATASTRLVVKGEVAHFQRELLQRGIPVGILHASVATNALKAERDAILWALILGNAAVTIGLSVLGYIAIRRMVLPLRTLSQRFATGSARPFAPTDMPHDNETAQLYEGYNRLLISLESRERLTRRLAEKERLAAMGQLASGMAHEINNPLGGLTTALETLETHGNQPEIRNRIVSLLRRGLEDIGRVVRSTLAAHRGATDTRALTSTDLDDLRVLMTPEINLRGQTLGWNAQFDTLINVPAGPVRQALLNLLLNASHASPPGGAIHFKAETEAGLLNLTVEDSGPGMPEVLAVYLSTDSNGEAPTRSGPHLGLWLVRSISNEINARVEVSRSALGGTRIEMYVPVGGADGRE